MYVDLIPMLGDKCEEESFLYFIAKIYIANTFISIGNISQGIKTLNYFDLLHSHSQLGNGALFIHRCEIIDLQFLICIRASLKEGPLKNCPLLFCTIMQKT